MAGDGASRRDIFRLLGRSMAELAGERIPGAAARAPAPIRPTPPAPADEVPMEGGRMVVDLAVHPVVPGTGRRFRSPSWPDAILVARVSEEHLAAVTGDCPHCEGPLRYDAGRDAVLCPSGAASFRLDGCVVDGAAHLRIRSFPCRRAGPRVEVDLAV